MLKDLIREALCAHYGLNARAIEGTAGGWCAAAFVAHTDSGKHFVKVYDRCRPSVQPWIARMASYMPVVLWLAGNTPLGERMAVPILTKNGDYSTQSADAVLLVFPFVEGQTLRDTPLTAEQTAQLAETLALLHSYGEEIPVPTAPLAETYTFGFADSLAVLIKEGDGPPALRDVLQTHAPALWVGIESLKLLAERLRAKPTRRVLCHTDLHGWNMIWNNHLILIDWEGLRLAPVESDLFVFADGFFFESARQAFFAAYVKARPRYVADQAALRFYCLRRRIEDISEFCSSIIGDDLALADREEALSCLRAECAALELAANNR